MSHMLSREPAHLVHACYQACHSAKIRAVLLSGRVDGAQSAGLSMHFQCIFKRLSSVFQASFEHFRAISSDVFEGSECHDRLHELQTLLPESHLGGGSPGGGRRIVALPTWRQGSSEDDS